MVVISDYYWQLLLLLYIHVALRMRIIYMVTFVLQ